MDICDLIYKIESNLILTVNDIARVCNVTTGTVRRWIRKGKLAAIQCGVNNHYIIMSRDFAWFLEQDVNQKYREMLNDSLRTILSADVCCVNLVLVCNTVLRG
jgi:excisionase family DNA binding protein